MFHLPCAHCHQPKRLDELQAWVYRDAFCSVDCAEAARGTGAYDAAPEPGALLSSATDQLEGAVRLCGVVAQAAVSAEQARWRAQDAIPRRGGLIGMAIGGAIGAHAQAEAERLENELVDHMYQLQQRSLTVLRDFMGLHALGYVDLVTEIQPLVTQYSGLVQPSHHPPVDQMGQLRAYLTHLHRGTSALLAQA